MRTNTRVEFGLYDVTARGDSVPSSTDTRGFCDLSSDLLLDKVPALPLYGTLETRQFLMDGSYSLFPDPLLEDPQQQRLDAALLCSYRRLGQ